MPKLNKDLSKALTKQEILDIAVAGILAQGEPSRASSLKENPGPRCRYRLGEKRCAIGWCIPDEQYQERFDDNASLQCVRDNVPSLHNVSYDFLSELQACHDEACYGGRDPENFIERFLNRCEQFAEQKGLEMQTEEEYAQICQA